MGTLIYSLQCINLTTLRCVNLALTQWTYCPLMGGTLMASMRSVLLCVSGDIGVVLYGRGKAADTAYISWWSTFYLV